MLVILADKRLGGRSVEASAVSPTLHRADE
jgi:hypothetical protein